MKVHKTFLLRNKRNYFRTIAKPTSFVAFGVINNYPGPGCSKLTMSLVNVSLKFQTLISNKYQYFWLKKCEKLFSYFFSKKYQCI